MSYDAQKITKAGDSLNRAIAMVNTVYLALGQTETEYDVTSAADTLSEAREKMLDAQELIGRHHSNAGGAL